MKDVIIFKKGAEAHSIQIETESGIQTFDLSKMTNPQKDAAIDMVKEWWVSQTMPTPQQAA